MDEGVGVDLGAFVWRPSQRIQEERIICEWKEPHALQSLEVDNLELARFLVTPTGVAIQCVSKKTPSTQLKLICRSLKYVAHMQYGWKCSLAYIIDVIGRYIR